MLLPLLIDNDSGSAGLPPYFFVVGGHSCPPTPPLQVRGRRPRLPVFERGVRCPHLTQSCCGWLTSLSADFAIF